MGEEGRNVTGKEDEKKGGNPPTAGLTTHLKPRIEMGRLAVTAGFEHLPSPPLPKSRS